jgi:glucokinase
VLEVPNQRSSIKMVLRVGIDLGGTNVRVGLVDEQGNIHEQLHDSTDPHDYEQTITKMVAMVEKVIQGKHIGGIGVGAPAPLDYKQGIILSPHHLPGWDRVKIVQRLVEQFHTKVHLNNDANVAALAEAKMGSGRGYDSVFYITVSTGVGGGFVLNGKLVNGAQGYAGEIGDMVVNPAVYTRANHNIGSLESYTSGTAIARIAQQHFGVPMNAKEVFILAEEGDPKAQEIIDDVVMYLAIGIANIAHTLNPDIFVMGGGVMQSVQFILTQLIEKVKEYLYPELADFIKIVPATLGGNAGIIGAAMLD